MTARRWHHLAKIPWVTEQPDFILSSTTLDETSWQAYARCAEVDSEIFFPDKAGSPAEAKKVCASCEVRADCLQYALDNTIVSGVWGGMGERERRRLRVARAVGREVAA